MFKFKNEQWPQELRDKIAFYANQVPEVNVRAIRHLAEDMRSQIILAIRAKQSRYATGHLMRSINREIVTEGKEIVRAAVGTPVEYAPYLEGGTRMHWIFPRFKKALSWRIQGGSYASKTKKWIGRAFSKGHIVSGIKAWNAFESVCIWAVGIVGDIYSTEWANRNHR